MTPASTILIVEDSPDDYEACVTALTKDNNLGNPIQWCESGDAALDYLHGRGAFADPCPAPPALVLLDLNMAGVDGRDVLLEIKSDPTMKTIPVVVMTSSRDPTDIDACYEDGANSYVVKPVDLNGFMEAVSRLKDYWFQVVVLPALK